jgi:hypothetical protein
MNPTRFPQLNQYTPAHLRCAFIKYANNQKKNDRHGIAYFIGMLDSHAGTLATYSDRKRADLMAQLFDMVTEQNIARLIQSDYTANELAKILATQRITSVNPRN